MGSDTPQDIGISVDHKGEAVCFGDPSFPDLTALSVELALHLFGSQRGVAEVFCKETDGFLSASLEVFGEALKVVSKAVGADQVHERRSLIRSSRFSNSLTLPALRSFSASRSPFCQDSNHHQL